MCHFPQILQPCRRCGQRLHLLQFVGVANQIMIITRIICQFSIQIVV